MPAAIHDNDSIALAMELRCCRVSWKRIEQGIGSGIAQAVRDAKKNGMHKNDVNPATNPAQLPETA